jgi:FixJ family two-component response regulator
LSVVREIARRSQHPGRHLSLGGGLLADAKRPRFDCLVLDVHLGGISGIELGPQLAAEADMRQ